MSTAGTLSDRSKKDLAELARRRGVRGWEGMNKDELLKALARNTASKNKPAMKTSRIPARSVGKSPAGKATPKSAPKVAVKPIVKEIAKPTAKSAAKITKPGKTETTEASAGAIRSSAGSIPSPAVNGTHGSTVLNNGPATKASTTSIPPKSATPSIQSKASTPSGKNATPPSPTPSIQSKASTPPGKNATPPSPTPSIQSKASTPPGKNATPPSSTGAKSDAAKAVMGKVLLTPAPQAKELPKEPVPAKPFSPPVKDRIIMAVHDPYWLHVSWELSSQSVQRAEAALKQDWYGAKLIIRLYDVTSQDTTSTSETPIRDIPIESDGSNWYINVSQPPRQYRADLGYISRRGMLFVLARSNVVTPPKAGSSEAIHAGWNMDTKKAERILAMSTGFESSGNQELREVFEERLKKSLGAPKETGFGSGATPPGSLKKFFFEIDAKLIVFGRTDPTAHLTLGNDPIKLNADGTFVMSFSLPDSRQIIPAVATSVDGVEERTIVLAVERNTKYLDPMIHDQMNEI
jgi:hypothetical protein